MYPPAAAFDLAPSFWDEPEHVQRSAPQGRPALTVIDGAATIVPIPRRRYLERDALRPGLWHLRFEQPG